MLISSLVDRFHHACRAHPLRKLNTRPRSSSPAERLDHRAANDFSISANPASLTLKPELDRTSAHLDRGHQREPADGEPEPSADARAARAAPSAPTSITSATARP